MNAFWINSSAYFGAGLCMGFGAIGAALGEGIIAGSASTGISRQPAVSGEILKMMLISQAVTESSAIFALVIAIFLLFQSFKGTTLTEAMALISSGFCMGMGALGSGIGCGFPGAKACEAISRNPKVSNKIMTAMLVGQAVDQTPTIFALFISLLLLFMNFSAVVKFSIAMAVLSAGISMGFGAVGPGIGGGIAAGYAIEGIGKNKELSGILLRTMLIGQAVSQSTSIYAMVISLVLLFVVK